MYVKAIKMLLGVRQSTPNDTCLIEAGYPSLEAAIRQRQRKFISRMKKERENMYDDPLMFALDITERDNPTMQRYLSGVLCEDGDIVQNDISRRKERLLSSQRTRAMTYCAMNPELSVHSIYTSCDVFADGLRIAFTRVRLSSHRLRVETGRWARIPHDQRICQCGLEVQTEHHVLANCHLVDEIRLSYSNSSVDFLNFMASPKSAQQLAMIERILDFYEHL